MTRLSYPVMMEIAGNTAMWTRPDTGACPVSYPVPTRSAVRGIFSNILWGPAIEIIPTKVEVCSPVQFHSYATNYGGPLRSSTLIRKDSNYQMFATVLIDVCYRLYAEIVPKDDKSKLPDSALEWDKKTTSPGHAYQSIFQRRLKRGQCFDIPVLGWSEFLPSYVGEFRTQTKVMTDLPDILIPSMLWEVFSEGYNTPVNYSYSQNLLIKNGVLFYSRKGDIV